VRRYNERVTCSTTTEGPGRR